MHLSLSLYLSLSLSPSLDIQHTKLYYIKIYVGLLLPMTLHDEHKISLFMQCFSRCVAWKSMNKLYTCDICLFRTVFCKPCAVG